MRNYILGDKLENMPFEKRPVGDDNPVWRYSANPIIPVNPQPDISRVYNSAVVAFGGAFIGVFRVEKRDMTPRLYLGRSPDGIAWKIEDRPILFTDENGKPRTSNCAYDYDPRVTRIEGVYYITWCTDAFGPVIALARTEDFKTFVKLENATLPCNRNGVLFPRRIGGRYYMLSRPSDMGHTAFGDIYLSQSRDLEFWGRHRRVLSVGDEWWQSLKVGAGPQPIETKEGWLLFYHGVIRNCNNYVYSMGGAILDLENPHRVKYRCANFLLTPEAPYETVGFVPSVVFPCAALADSSTGRIAIYYGAADSCTGLAFTEVDTITDYIIKNNGVSSCACRE